MKTLPRDLSTVEAHIERAESWSTELWKANNIDLHMCDRPIKKGQHGLLSDIRHDTSVLLHLIAEYKELNKEDEL